jgi:DNA polymerase-3 subunit delta
MILARAGDDLRTLSQELEKLVLFVGDQTAITAQDVDEIFLDQSEGWIFDLTRAIGERNPAAALSQLARLTAQGDHPLKLLGSIAGEIRRLIAARQLIDGELRDLWRRGMSYQQFQQKTANRGALLLTRSPWGDYQCLQRAEQFPLSALLAHIENIFDADLRLKSSGVQGRLVMEQLLLTMCLGKGRRMRMGLPRTNL